MSESPEEKQSETELEQLAVVGAATKAQLLARLSHSDLSTAPETSSALAALLRRKSGSELSL